MTQTFFATNENNPNIHVKLNQAVQGHRFRHRTQFIGLSEVAIFNFNFRTTAVHVRMVGDGGGGGGARQVAGPEGIPTLATVATGGGSGAYYEFFLTDSTLLGNTFYISAPPGGAGGPPNSPGVNGGNARIEYDKRIGPLVARTHLAFAGGGQGGAAMATGASSTVLLSGGLGGLTENYRVTPNDIFMKGEKGGFALRENRSIEQGGVFAYSGRGGDSVFSGGGRSSIPVDGHGKPALGIGGGGAAADNGFGSVENYSGGKGGDAAVYIDEYY